MKTLIIIFALTCFVGSDASSQALYKTGADSLIQRIDASDTPLVVCFWATYCKPCLHEMPYFQAAVKKLPPGRVTLVFVSLDPAAYYPRTIAAFASAMKLEFPVFWLNEPDGRPFFKGIGPGWNGVLPATLFIDRRKGYRKFFDRQLTPLQFQQELGALLR